MSADTDRMGLYLLFLPVLGACPDAGTPAVDVPTAIEVKSV